MYPPAKFQGICSNAALQQQKLFFKLSNAFIQRSHHKQQIPTLNSPSEKQEILSVIQKDFQTELLAEELIQLWAGLHTQMANVLEHHAKAVSPTEDSTA